MRVLPPILAQMAFILAVGIGTSWAEEPAIVKPLEQAHAHNDYLHDLEPPHGFGVGVE